MQAESPTASLLKDAPVSLPDSKKIEKFLDVAASKAGEDNPTVARIITVLKPFIIIPIQAVLCLAPLYFWMLNMAYTIYSFLPTNVLTAIFGLALCFFGGTYVASIAAIEAFRQLGGKQLYGDLQLVLDEIKNVQYENAKDDLEDKDGDGVFDVDQITASELAQRKTLLVMRSITKPSRLQNAAGSLWTAYIAVLATLRLEFARTTAFAIGIVEIIKYPAVRTLSPLLLAVLSKELPSTGSKAWSVTIVESALTLIAVAFAWYLQMVISALYSGLRGGRLFADAVCEILIEKGWMEKLPFVSVPFKADESYLDELLGYSMAAFGFLFQLVSGFGLPFPLNIIFLPLTLIEWFLRIQITMTAEVAH